MVRFASNCFFAALLLVITAIASGASAQNVVNTRATEGVVLPASSTTEVNDATALSVNPANIGFLDSWSFVYAGSWLADQRHLAGQGHGLFLALPIGPLGLALATEFLTPPGDIEEWQGLDNRMRFSMGLSLNPIRALGFGVAYRTFFYYDLGDIDTFDFFLTVRPVNYLAMAVTLGDANRPEVAFNATESRAGARIPSRIENVPRRFGVALTIRPLGTDRLAIGGELNYLYGESKVFIGSPGTFEDRSFRRTDVNALLSWMLVDGLMLRTRFGAEGLRDDDIDNGYFLDFALSIDSRRFPLGMRAGSHFKLSPKDGRGFEALSWAVRISGDEAPSLPFHLPPTRAVLFEIEKRIDSYGEARLMALMDRVTDDKAVDILVLRPDAKTINLDQALDIRRRIREMNAAGKKTVCYLTEATSSVYLACAPAREIWINPAGGIRLAGMSMKSVHFKNLFDKIGIQADIVRIGEYKSAPETFTRTSPTDPSVQATERYLDSVYAHVIANLERDRGFSGHDATRNVIEDGPYTSSEALAAGLVDRVVPADKLNEELQTLSDGPVAVNDEYGKDRLRHRSYIDAPAVAVVHIDGDIIDGESVDVPFFNIRMTGAKTMTEELRKLAENPEITAVVLKINSPGGSALASDMIWREVMALREKKTVIASLGSVAASGGYYIASAADVIYAEPTTLTGSIGIFYGKADVSGLLGKIGIDITTFKRGSHSDMESWTRPYTPEERRKLLGQIREYYNLFLDRVVEGRGNGFTREIVDKRGRGRIWSGADAKHHLLVDELGGYPEALNYARNVGFVSKSTRVYHVPKVKKGLLRRLIGLMKASTDTTTPLDALLGSTEMKSALKAVLPFAVSDHGAPQARLPFAILDE